MNKYIQNLFAARNSKLKCIMSPRLNDYGSKTSRFWRETNRDWLVASLVLSRRTTKGSLCENISSPSVDLTTNFGIVN